MTWGRIQYSIIGKVVGRKMSKEKEVVLTKYAMKTKGIPTTDMLAKFFSPEGKPEALDDILVLDVSYANFAGVVASSLLAEFGAEVIKIEPPEGDPSRTMTPHGVNLNGVGIPFLMESRNKRYFTLELENKEDREDFKKLAAKADVVIETFEPGKMDSWGIGYRQLSKINPKIIYVAITPFGQMPPEELPYSTCDSDLTAQALSGLCALLGDLPSEPEPYNWPVRAGVWASWYISGISAALGVLLALLYRRLSGKGQMIDVATADSYANCVGYPIIVGSLWEKPRPRAGMLDPGAFPYSIWKCKDGYVAITAARDNAFRALLKILGLWKLEPDWRFTYDRVPDIIENALELYKEIENKTIQWKADDLVKKGMEYSAKALRSFWRGGGTPMIVKMEFPGSVIKNPHWQIRGSFIEVDEPSLGKFVIPANPIKMTGTPPRVKWVSWEIGRDNQYVREKYIS
jgi:crotonobetainyl-CoA:carnitine CoA-transferase CaiB-like acyl-CoA transferase